MENSKGQSRRSKSDRRRRRKEVREEEAKGRRKEEEKIKKGKNDGNKKDSRGMEYLGQGERRSKVQRRDQEISFLKIPKVDLCLWKENE